MVKKATITFVETSTPCTELVTKFGGQPVWYNEPQWPLSRSTGKPMQFICQIAIDAELFPSAQGKMAYLFMTQDDKYVHGMWEPHDGENALIIQPGECEVPVKNQATGPTLCKMVDEGKRLLVPVPFECLVDLRAGEDPDFVSPEERRTLSKEEAQNLPKRLNENKIGGTPVFMQNAEFPGGGPWKLLLQLDACSVPFYFNVGDAGVGYAFIDETGTRGKFLWQCA